MLGPYFIRVSITLENFKSNTPAESSKCLKDLCVLLLENQMSQSMFTVKIWNGLQPNNYNSLNGIHVIKCPFKIRCNTWCSKVLMSSSSSSLNNLKVGFLQARLRENQIRH